MQHDHPLIISLDAVEARDAWGFVGVVRVGDCEAYRTLRSYPVPSEARTAVEQLLANVLGTLLAGQEWRHSSDELGHPPAPLHVGLGPGPRHPDARNGQTQPAE